MPDDDRRLKMLDALIEKGSTDPFVWYARAMELRSLERLPQALSAYQEVRDRFPEYLPTYLMAAQVALALDRIEDAQCFLEGGLEKARFAGDAHATSELVALLASLTTLQPA